MPIFNVGAAGTTSSAFDVPYGLHLAENAYQTRTPSSSSNRRTFTISIWVKLNLITTTTQYFIGGASSGSDYALLRYENFNFEWIAYNGSGVQTAYLRTTAQYKDPSAWYHIVVASDTTQATNSNRTKMYVNGVQITDFQTENYPSQNADYNYNHNIPHTFGAFNDGASSQGGYFYGYMCEIVSIDGSQLEPTSFGEFDSDSNIWKPKSVSGLTFGTNGFYLNFATRATDAIDASGNGNNFSSTNVLATDHSIDTCTNNYAVMNYLNSGANWKEGNLRVEVTTQDDYVASTLAVSQGKWYLEFKIIDQGTRGYIGFTDGVDIGQTPNNIRSSPAKWGMYMPAFSSSSSTSGTVNSNLGTATDNDIICFAFDADNGQLWMSKNGNIDTSATAQITGITTGNFFHCFVQETASGGDISEYHFNFGNPIGLSISSSNSDANGHGNFEYAVPSGYYALNTKNLAEFG